MADNTYVKFLASQSNTDISKWDMRAFGSLRDKTKINKKFFELKEKQESQEKKKKVKIPKVPKDINAKAFMKVEKVLRDDEAQMAKLTAELRKLQERMIKSKKDLDKLSKKDSSGALEAQIAEVVKQGFWENPIIVKDMLYFNTKNNVILTHINKRAKLNISKNMGKYAVAVNLNTFETTLLVYENNLDNEGGIHAYGCNAYVPCYGNAYEVYHRLRTEMNLVKLMHLLSVLLTTYSDIEPMFCLQYFKEEHKWDYEEGIMDLQRNFNYEKEYLITHGWLHPDVAEKYWKPYRDPDGYDDDEDSLDKF